MVTVPPGQLNQLIEDLGLPRSRRLLVFGCLPVGHCVPLSHRKLHRSGATEPSPTRRFLREATNPWNSPLSGGKE